LTYAHFLRCGAPSYVWPESGDKAGLCAKQPHDSKEKYLNRPAMWASAQSDFARGFCELSTKVLNKVIHRPVESLTFSKIILNLAPIVMFHFKCAGQSLVLSSARGSAGAWRRCSE
jgi:hypothetical protein